MRVISIICIFLTVHTVFLLLYLGTLAACLGKSSSSCRRRRTSSQLTSPSPPTVGPSEPSMEGPPSDLKFWREKKHNPFYVKRPWITTCPTRFSDIPTALHRIRWWWEWRSDSNSSLAAGGRTARQRLALQQARCNSRRRLATTAAAALLLCHMSATAAAPLAGFDSFALYPILACLEKMSCILQQYFQWKTSSSSSSSFDSSFYHRIPYYVTLVQLYKAALHIIYPGEPDCIGTWELVPPPPKKKKKKKKLIDTLPYSKKGERLSSRKGSRF